MTHIYVTKLVHPWLRFRLMALRRQVYHQLNSSEHILWNFNQNTTLILQEGEFEKVVSASVNIHPLTSYLTSWSSFRVFTVRFPGSNKHYNDVIIGAQRASNAENVSIWWCRRVFSYPGHVYVKLIDFFHGVCTRCVHSGDHGNTEQEENGAHGGQKVRIVLNLQPHEPNVCRSL